jgi:hypothetical protein
MNSTANKFEVKSTRIDTMTSSKIVYMGDKTLDKLGNKYNSTEKFRFNVNDDTKSGYILNESTGEMEKFEMNAVGNGKYAKRYFFDIRGTRFNYVIKNSFKGASTSAKYKFFRDAIRKLGVCPSK